MKTYSRSSASIPPKFDCKVGRGQSFILIRFSKPQKTGTIMLTSPIQRGLREISFEENHENDLSNVTMTPQTISSLHLPEPLFSIQSPYSKLMFSDNGIQQVDGAQPSKNHGRKPARNRVGISNPSIQFNDNHATDSVDPEPHAPQDEPTRIIQSHPYSGLHKTPHSSGTLGNSHQSRFQSPPGGRSMTRELLAPVVGATNLTPSSDSSLPNLSPAISPRPQGDSSPLTSGEVLRVIGHKPWGNKNLQYMILWRSRDSGVPTGLWVRAADFIESGKRAILEGYHIHHNLGPVRWPRDPRRQLRSSTSFGVQELKSALDERKQMLLARGVDELEASREMNYERWKMRDEWQRAGRGWGSAMMIVKDRKKAWSVADSDAEELQSTATAKLHDIHTSIKGSESSFSDYVTMMQTAGMLDLDSDQDMLKQNSKPFNLNSSPKKGLWHKSISPPNIPELGDLTYSDMVGEEARYQFGFTSEDEREWREIFGPELVRSSVSASKHQGDNISNICY